MQTALLSQAAAAQVSSMIRAPLRRVTPGQS
jgi:hypothetical protein